MLRASDIFISTGRCRCRAFTATLVLSRPPGAIPPRACQCAFCLEHAAVTLADPEGHLAIEAIEPSFARYRAWDEKTVTLHCARCETYVAVLMSKGSGWFGALNIAGLALSAFDDVPALAVDDELETKHAKMKRRRADYMPVELLNIAPPDCLTAPRRTS